MNNVYIAATACFAVGLIQNTSGLAAEVQGVLTPKAPGDIPSKFEAHTERFDHTRLEVMVPMRDGVKLYTLVMLPKHTPGPLPIILTRTPYNASSRGNARGIASPQLAMALRPDDEPLLESGYVRVYQDVRGKHKSEGAYILNMPLVGSLNRGKVDHSTDTWDTIEWLVKNVPNNNGKVGVTGSSYEGFTTLMALVRPHPALAAAVPAHSMVDTWMGDDWFHHGAFRQVMIEWMYQQTATKDASKALPLGYHDLYSAFLDAGSAGEFSTRYGADRLPAWKRMLDEPAYSAFWRDQALHEALAKTPHNVPTLTVHGLFDQEDMFGSLASYAAMEQHDGGNGRNFLVVGPWHHSQYRSDGFSVGHIKWRTDTSRWFREKVRQPFWDEHLKGVKPQHPLAPVLAFDTGVKEWREYAEWPPRVAGATAKRLYLQPGGKLAFAPPPADGGATDYVSDPAKPVPFRVRPILRGGHPENTWSFWLTDDQRPFSDRLDVLTFMSEPLVEPLTVRGDVIANLVAATTGTDADWVVKLIDVFPEEYPPQTELGGYQFMIAGDILRGRYRESFSEPKPIAAGAALPYRFQLPDVNHTFARGHRLMVQVQSTWFPLYDRNPQKYVDNIAYAKPGDYQRATHSVHHSAGRESYVEVTVYPE
jgi:uncharacterized protein